MQHNGRVVYVGSFDTLDEADAAARAKRLELFSANYADRMVSVQRAARRLVAARAPPATRRS